MPGSPAASFTFTGGPVFDIDAAPNGNVLVAETVLDGVASGPTTIWEIVTRGRGGTSELVQFSTPGGITPVNGLATVGRGSFFAARGGLDLAENAAVLHVTPAGARVVGDVEAFEKAEDPDLTGSAAWKDGACAAASGPFTPGPQSNPFHLAAVSGSTVLLADAAGNTLLRVGKDGDVELVALFTPPADGGGASDDPTDWLEFPFEPADDGFCFVQPVPNSVAVGPDGGIYVGELTGVGALGVSRVWRIAPGATDVVCPSADCTVAFSDFTSIIDLAFGPDGDLHVVEYDEAGWLTSVGVGTPEGGTVNRCDVEAGSCEIATIGDEVLEELTFPAALTFDRTGGAWLLENNLAAPTVRKLN
ncbi:MAG: ScyD/ScyE family protein [Gemmatimonadota bacterium]